MRGLRERGQGHEKLPRLVMVLRVECGRACGTGAHPQRTVIVGRRYGTAIHRGLRCENSNSHAGAAV